MIGTGLAEMKPGSLRGLQLTLTDMEAVRAGLIERGVEVSEVEVLGREGRPGFDAAHFSDPAATSGCFRSCPPGASGPVDPPDSVAA